MLPRKVLCAVVEMQQYLPCCSDADCDAREVVGLRLDQLQSREGHSVIVNLVGKGGRIRTVPVPTWCKELVDSRVRKSGVIDGKDSDEF